MQPRDVSTLVKEFLTDVEPAELGPGPRPGVQSQAKLEAAIKSLPNALGISPANRELIRGLVFLWHDHLDASHAISQGIDNADGSFIHAIMHRREPDYWNSKYWWRRVGKHSCFPEMAERVSELLKSKNERDLAAKLVPRGEWDAFAFVDACQAAADLLPSDERCQLLREIQKVETEVLLEYLLKG